MGVRHLFKARPSAEAQSPIKGANAEMHRTRFYEKGEEVVFQCGGTKLKLPVTFVDKAEIPYTVYVEATPDQLQILVDNGWTAKA